MNDLSYPIGRFTPPAEYTPALRAAFIDDIAGLPVRLRAAVRNLTPDQLDTPYRDGGWTVAQVVHHVADSHINAFVRIKLALTEYEPTIKPYYQGKWASLPDGSTVAIEDSLRIVDALHARWTLMLGDMAPSDFSRVFVHPERGPQTIDRNVAMYAWHGQHHAAHITSLRQRKGW